MKFLLGLADLLFICHGGLGAGKGRIEIGRKWTNRKKEEEIAGFKKGLFHYT